MALPTCLRCQVPMEPGFMTDQRHHSTTNVQRWCPGEPEASFWSGEVKTSQAKEGLKVFSYRCPACGLLESYAITKV